ncbi:MAG TPA: DUF2949 domain-containing protein [Stenomitos sp.]
MTKTSTKDAQFRDYLTTTLGLTEIELRVAMRDRPLGPTQLPIALWQRGFIEIEQMETLLDWWDEGDIQSDR